jgi:hypothetical protein
MIYHKPHMDEDEIVNVMPLMTNRKVALLASNKQHGRYLAVDTLAFVELELMHKITEVSYEKLSRNLNATSIWSAFRYLKFRPQILLGCRTWLCISSDIKDVVI